MKPERRTIRLGEIVFDEAIYPRHDHDPVLVQKYAECIESIEAAGQYIGISPEGKLLDGKHRWLAYRKAYGNDPQREIPVFVYPVTESHEQFALAVELNSQHGYQLTSEDKRQCAIKMYGMGFSYDTIAAKLSVGKTKVSEWLSRTVKEEKEKRNRRIFELWLACYTQEEIAEAVGCSQQNVAVLLKEYQDTGLVKLTDSQQALANYLVDFEPPIYNIWKQQEKTPGVNHFGNSEARWVDNLLYLYTEPFDVVVDPFAGSGSTIDICRKRFRRYWVSDRLPVVEREKEIRKWDVTEGLPPIPRWQDVKLVYLDPPYWKQAEGQYSDNPTDLANMTLEQFNETLAGLINSFGKKLPPGAVIALIIQPTQWKAPDRKFVDHVGDMLRMVRLPVDMRFSAPYESQQCTAQMVEWAKQNKRCLVLTREIVVWRRG